VNDHADGDECHPHGSKKTKMKLTQGMSSERA